MIDNTHNWSVTKIFKINLSHKTQKQQFLSKDFPGKSATKARLHSPVTLTLQRRPEIL